MSKRIKLDKNTLLEEIQDIADNLEHLLKEIVKNDRSSLTKPLSVELRKLYSPTRGNDLLKRIEKEFGINLEFPDRGKKLPPRTVKVGVDEYRDNLIFALQGRKITRIKLINLIAGQTGAHLDDSVDRIHFQSKKIKLPLGNPARDGVLLDQNSRYLVEIANVTLKVVKEQILNKHL